MTAKYPIHIGMHHLVIESNSPWGLTLKETLFPQYLQSLGYRTYMVGKWHLGHFNEDYLPTRRGFDRFYGFYGNCISYFSHISELGACRNPNCFFDLRDGDEEVRDRGGEHTSYVLSSVVDEMVAKHPSDKPMFLYYPVANVHSPIMAPEHMLENPSPEVSKCLGSLANKPRRIYAALTYLLDEAVANMTRALRTANLYENSIIIVASDNGANPLQENTTEAGGSGSNFPFRGMKGYMFDGGVRVPAFVHSPLIPVQAKGTEFHGIFHVSDWLPTIVGGVLGRSDLYRKVDMFDGKDQWSALLRQGPQPRHEVLINIDDLDGAGCLQTFSTAAIRVGDWKLIMNEADLPVWPVVTTSHVPNEFFIDWGGTMNWCASLCKHSS